MLSLLCVLNIYYGFVITVYSIYIVLSSLMRTQYILCFYYLCVLNIYYAFVIMCTQYIFCFHYLPCALIYIMLSLSTMCTHIYYAFVIYHVHSYILCFRYYCVLNIHYAFVICTRHILCFCYYFVLNVYHAFVIIVYSILCFCYYCVLNIYYAFVIYVFSIYIMLLLFMCT